MRKFYIYVLVAVFLYGICGSKSESVMENPQRRPDKRAGLFSIIQGSEHQLSTCFSFCNGNGVCKQWFLFNYAITLVFKTLQVVDVFACVMACLEDPSCQSVNYDTSGYPKHLCELSNKSLGCTAGYKEDRPGFHHYYFPLQAQPDDPKCQNATCKNGATCIPACNEQGYRCECGAFNQGQHCQLWTVDVTSCKDVFSKTSYRTDMAYTYMIDNNQTDIYCHLSSDLCGSRGWTLAMKTDGSKNTFAYNSALWSNKNAYDLSAGQTGFDNHETKMSSYWAMPFQRLCAGMKVGNTLNWALIPYTASSLYDVIADGRRRTFSIGRNKWLSLIGGSSLQNNCNDEAFNTVSSVRIGIRTNQENNCNSPDSAIGFGLPWSGFTCGNRCRLSCSNGDKDIKAFGYILIK